MEIKNISEIEYENFIKEYTDILFFQSVEWAKFKSKTNWDMEIIGLFEGENLKAASILLSQKLPFIKRKMYYCPRGFVIDYSNYDLIKEYTTYLKNYLKSKKAIFLKINPYVEYQKRDKDGNIIEKDTNKPLIDYFKKLGYKHYGFYIEFNKKKDLEPRWLSVLNLENKSVDELVKNMRQTTRWMINKSQKNCITISEAVYDDLPKYKELMKHTAERRNFIDRPLSYYQTMYDCLNETGMFKLLLAHIDLERLKMQVKDDINRLQSRIDIVQNNPKKENQVLEFNNQIKSLNHQLNDIEEKEKSHGSNPLIAAGLYLSYGDQVVYLFGGSYKEFMSYGAQYLMQYEMIKFAKDNGYKKLNFYGIDGDFRREGLHYGLFDFKRGFNSDVVELIGEFDLVVNRFYYALYNIMFGTYKLIKKVRKK